VQGKTRTSAVSDPWPRAASTLIVAFPGAIPNTRPSLFTWTIELAFEDQRRTALVTISFSAVIPRGHLTCSDADFAAEAVISTWGQRIDRRQAVVTAGQNGSRESQDRLSFIV
jgi:hypothetical protein